MALSNKVSLRGAVYRRVDSFRHSQIGTSLRKYRRYIEYFRTFSRDFTDLLNNGDRKPLTQILREAKLVSGFWGCLPFHYFNYKLYTNHFDLTDSDLIDYIPNWYYCNIFADLINNADYSAMDGDKNIFDVLLHGAGVPVPEPLCKVARGAITDRWFSILSREDVESRIASATSDRIFVKPVAGAGGEGFVIFRKNKDKLGHTNDEGHALAYETLQKLAAKTDWIVQQGVVQHVALNNLHASSVNTLRPVTERRPDGSVRIVAVTLRIGTGGGETDNAHVGGISCGVDVDSWCCEKWASTDGSLGPVRWTDRHPDSGIRFEGYQLPYRDEVLAILERGARTLYPMPIMSWDVAFTPTGPLILEANAGLGLDHLQAASHRGLRRAFGIEPWRQREGIPLPPGLARADRERHR